MLLGGPRHGYLAGTVFSAAVAVVILWRYQLSLLMRWLVALLLVAYYGGGALMVGSDVLAHVSLGNDALRYDRMIHVLGATIAVLLVAEIASRRHPLPTWLVMVVAVGAGLVVEAVELATALVLPRVFSYDLVDSSLDVAGNTAGLVLGFAALLWARRRPLSRYRTAGSV